MGKTGKVSTTTTEETGKKEHEAPVFHQKIEGGKKPSSLGGEVQAILSFA